jgi:uncharacterized protein YegL
MPMSSLEPMPAEPRQRILPFYICLDVSYSMAGSKLEAARHIFPALIDTLTVNPMIGDVTRVAIIQFSDEAKVIVPLSDPRDLMSVPVLEVESGTSFGRLFRLLRSLILDDFDRLNADGYSIHRPVVFILTDGEPTDDWINDFERLTDFDRRTGVGFRLYPIIVPFGVEGSDISTLRRIASPRGRSKVYLSSETVSPEEAIRELTQVMIQSVVSSATHSTGPPGVLVLPAEDEIGPALTVDEIW